MNKIAEFIRKERLYLLLFILVVIIGLSASTPAHKPKLAKKDTGSVSMQERHAKGDLNNTPTSLQPSREEVEKIFKEKKYLAVLFSLSTLLIIALLLLGIAVDLILISMNISGKPPDISTYKLGVVRWNIWDVCKVVILFVFFGYMIVLTESSLVRLFPVIKNENLRMIFNSSILDILVIVFIVNIAVGQYKEKLVSLGISVKNFFKNVFYGIVAYIAAIPLLIAVLVVIAVISNILKYVPERQPVVDLFLKEKDPAFLLYTSLFAAVVGPIIEELFFRAFMYATFKKYIGVFWAIMITSSFFALLHAHLVGFLPIMILGVVLAYIYEKTGTIVSSITAHAIHNLSMVFLVFLVKQLTA